MSPPACRPPSTSGRVLRELPNAALQFLLDGTVTALQLALPPEVDFGDAVAGDTKHIIAWVKENNPKAYINDRYDKTQQPAGDPDCKLGCKRRHNRGAAGPESTLDAAEGAPAPAAGTPPPSGSGAAPATRPAGTPARQATVGEYYWGYASGVIATKVADWGEFVLAELTQTFDQPDVSYFFPLMAQVERRLGRKPRYGAFDMGFDAHYIYDYFHTAGGFAAVPLAERGDTSRQFDAAGLPLCPAGLAMPCKGVFTCHTSRFEQQRGRYACPLRYPKPTGERAPSAIRIGPRAAASSPCRPASAPASATSWTARAKRSRPSTSNARPMNGSTVRRSSSASSGPSCATARPSPTRIP